MTPERVAYAHEIAQDLEDSGQTYSAGIVRELLASLPKPMPRMTAAEQRLYEQTERRMSDGRDEDEENAVSEVDCRAAWREQQSDSHYDR